MKRIGQVLSILAASLTLLAAAFPAQAYIYSGKRKRINCGIVLLNNGEDRVANSIDCNGIPYRTYVKSNLRTGFGRDDAYSLFTIMNARTDLKPLGWSLENPHSPGGMFTGDPSRPEDKPENNPEYWFINLHTFRDLSDMQVLYLPTAGKPSLDKMNDILSDDDCEKLRRFVDAGGVLWIDNVVSSIGTPLNFQDHFFIHDFRFEETNGGTDLAVSRHHPLLTLPFWISEPEIAALGDTAGKYHCIPGYDIGVHNVRSSVPLTFDILYPIVNNSFSGKPSIVGNAYGSGRIVATANGVGPACLKDYPFNIPNVKFAYNVLAWSASWTHLRKDPRHSGSSIDTVGGTKLVESWAFPGSGSTEMENAPVIYKNMVFYSSGSRLVALDLAPDEDLDQDGNPDDGLNDITNGSPPGVDIVWKWDEPTGTPISAPTLITAQDPTDQGQSIDAVMVMSKAGVVYVLYAFPNTNGKLDDKTDFCRDSGGGDVWGVWPTGGDVIDKPYPPIYINGWIYAVTGDGHLRAYNPSLDAMGVLNYNWNIPNPGINCAPKAGPAFGWVKNDTNGALIGVVYWSGERLLTDPILNDYIYGAPVFVANDHLSVHKTSTTGTEAECRIALSNIAVATNPMPDVHIIKSDGSEIDVEHVLPNQRIGRPNMLGWMVVQTTDPIPSDAHIVASYVLDYSTAGSLSVPIRKWLEPSTTDGLKTELVGIPALGPDNMIYACGTRNSTSGDSIYGMQNDGTNHNCKWNFELHSGVGTGSIPSGSAIDVPAVVFTKVDAGGTTTIVPLDEPKVYGSPAVSRDKVYVAVSGTPDPNDPTKPTAALLCFKANPEFVIRITEAAGFFGAGGNPIRRPKRLYDATGRKLSVRIWQPDLLNLSTPGIPPPVGASVVTSNLDMIDYDKGTITFRTFDRLKLRPSITAGAVTNTFTPSLPVWVYVENMEVPIDFNTWGPAVRAAEIYGTPLSQPLGDAVDLSQWNNLLWYYVIPPHDDGPCTGIKSSPVVIGNTVYFVCEDGYLYAIPTDTEESSGGQVKAERLIWCGDLGHTGAQGTSIAGANGVLLVPTFGGIQAYTNATTLVADSGRILEVDGSGEATWNVDLITWPASAPQDAKTSPPRMSGPVNKPAKAKYAGPGEILVVNTGANQVCKIDKSGTVGLESVPNNASDTPQFIRYIWDKFTDPKHLLRSGQPTELRGPTDAIYWREWENNKLVLHCLVADSGNHRIVDLVYRIGYDNNHNLTGLALTDSEQTPDSTTRFYLPELNWVTATDSMNEQYVYESLQLMPNSNTDAGQDIWAAISNYRTGTDWATGAAAGKGLGGAVVAIKYRLPVSGGWKYYGSHSGEIIAACDKADWSGDIRPLAQPKYFQAIDKPATSPGTSAERYLVICDNYGVYKVGPLGGGSAAPVVTKAFTDNDYRDAPREAIKECDNAPATIDTGIQVPLQACYVQELRNGNWVVTNNYAGANKEGTKRFKGEVFELKWDSGTAGISWSAPMIYCECDSSGDPLLGTWKQSSKTTYEFQQPTSAVRQF